jgi:hypothetical protein
MKRVWIVPRNSKAKIAQRTGIVVAILMVLFPPWKTLLPSFRVSLEEFAGYHPLWRPPENAAGIAVGILLLQLLILAIITKTAVRFLNRFPERSKPTDH